MLVSIVIVVVTSSVILVAFDSIRNFQIPVLLAIVNVPLEALDIVAAKDSLANALFERCVEAGGVAVAPFIGMVALAISILVERTRLIVVITPLAIFVLDIILLLFLTATVLVLEILVASTFVFSLAVLRSCLATG